MSHQATKHERAVWEQFWEQKTELSTVYSPSARIIDNLRAVTEVQGKKVLEVGAGTGRTSFELMHNSAYVVILDYAESSLSIVQELLSKANKSADIIRADAFHLPFKNNTFDIVFHQGLLEHFKNPKPLLKENYRVLSHGGLALVDVPQRYHIYTIIKHILIWLNKWFAGWETEFSIGELKCLLPSAGFNIVHFYGEWMRPSLFYRIFREVVRKFGINLTLYPQSIDIIARVRAGIRNAIRWCPFAVYTYLDIGVVGKKGGKEGEIGN
jgi:ubiquinone/menaquinone biosynthesis C-methylase UbiE